MDNSQDNNGLVTGQVIANHETTITPPEKKPRQSISYKTEWQKSTERADKLSRWALIGWALAIIELVWLIILTSI